MKKRVCGIFFSWPLVLVSPCIFSFSTVVFFLWLNQGIIYPVWGALSNVCTSLNDQLSVLSGCCVAIIITWCEQSSLNILKCHVCGHQTIFFMGYPSYSDRHRGANAKWMVTTCHLIPETAHGGVKDLIRNFCRSTRKPQNVRGPWATKNNCLI